MHNLVVRKESGPGKMELSAAKVIQAERFTPRAVKKS